MKSKCKLDKFCIQNHAQEVKNDGIKKITDNTFVSFGNANFVFIFSFKRREPGRPISVCIIYDTFLTAIYFSYNC